MTQKVYNGDSSKRAAYLYGADGSLAQTVDYSVGTRTQFTYDLANRLVSQKEYATTAKNGGTLRSSTDFTYADKTNYLTGVKHYSPLGTQTIGYTYGDINQGQMPDQIYKVSWNGQEKVNYTYDPLGRLTQKSVILSDNAGAVGGDVLIAPLTTEYSYVDSGENKTTTLVQSVQTAAGTYSYTYDAVGNITSVSDGTYTTSYEYDDLNQLVRVNDQQESATYTYEYENGNILSQKQYAYTTGSLAGMSYSGTEFLYGDGTWSDLMTGFVEIQGVNGGAETSAVSAYALQNTAETAQGIKTEGVFSRAMARKNSGVSTYSTRESAAPMFTYDGIGNPTNILGVEMGWNGRQLTELTAPEDSYASHVTYAYNIDGQRVSKTVTLAEDQSTQTTEYFYNGEILAGQKTGDNTLVFMYDNNGDYFGFTVNGTPYYYVKNAQNDVTAVTDANGTILLRYHYNAWGEVWIESFFENDAEATEEAYLNPITYRSYYLDFETAFYYLNTRYYIPMFCRFLNADGMIGANQDIHAYNLFAYCSNNPVNFYDPSGCYTITIPAEGDGSAIVGRFPWEPEISVEKIGDTYVATPSSNIPSIFENTAGVAGVAIGDKIVELYFEGIYIAEREITYRTVGNIVLRTFVPKSPTLAAMKSYAKGVGIVSTVAFVFDTAMNFKTYGGFTKDFAKATVVTSVMAAAGVAVGLVGAAIVAAELAPAIAVGCVVFGIGVLLSFGEDAWKTRWIGY